MKTRTAAAIALCVTAGVLIPAYLIAGQVPAGDEGGDGKPWAASWVFEQDPYVNASFFNPYRPLTQVCVTWPGWPDSGMAAGARTPYQFLPFMTLSGSETQLEAWIGHAMRDGEVPFVFVGVRDGETRILFHDRTAWVMSVAWFGQEYLGEPTDVIVDTITRDYGGIPIWGVFP